MKKMSRNIIISCIAVSLASCNGSFLDNVQPKISAWGGGYFKTDADFEQAVNSVYATFYGQLSPYIALNELRSDNTCVYYNPSERAGIVNYEEIDEFRDKIDNPVSNYWDPAYKAIYQINEILARITDVSFDNEELKKRITGECKFSRAFYYYNLVLFYGDVPLIIDPITSLADAFKVGRTNAESVYSQILQDVHEAIELLPTGYDGDNVGRITKGAAFTLLAKIQMTKKDFPTAAKTLHTITSLGYDLQTDYQDCFDPAKKNNSESIFEIQYNSAVGGLSNNHIFTWIPIGSEAYMAIFGYVGSNRNGWNIPTKDLMNAYEAGDLRKDISVKPGYRTSNGDFIEAGYINKWIYDAGIQGRNDCNFPVYRYADILLMLAEALNEQAYEGNGEAFTYLNRVRNRAGLTSLGASDIPNQDAFRRAVAAERRVELAFEGHRWPDLVRTGQAIPVMKAHGAVEKANPSTPRGFGDEYLDAAFANIQPFRLIYPIPYKEILKTPDVLEQNDGY